MSYVHQNVRCLRGFCLQELMLDDVIFDALKYYDAYRPDKLIELAGVCDCIRCAPRGWRPMTYSQAGILQVSMGGSYSYGTYPYKWLSDRNSLARGPLAPITANLRRRPVPEREAGMPDCITCTLFLSVDLFICARLSLYQSARRHIRRCCYVILLRQMT
jgi:hypothetical protein